MDYTEIIKKHQQEKAAQKPVKQPQEDRYDPEAGLPPLLYGATKLYNFVSGKTLNQDKTPDSIGTKSDEPITDYTEIIQKKMVERQKTAIDIQNQNTAQNERDQDRITSGMELSKFIGLKPNTPLQEMANYGKMPLPPLGARSATSEELISNQTTFQNQDLMEQLQLQSQPGFIEKMMPAVAGAAAIGAAPAIVGMAAAAIPAVTAGITSAGQAAESVSMKYTGMAASKAAWEILKITGLGALSTQVVSKFKQTPYYRPLANTLGQGIYSAMRSYGMAVDTIQNVFSSNKVSFPMTEILEEQNRHTMAETGTPIDADVQTAFTDFLLESATYIMADKSLEKGIKLGNNIYELCKPLYEAAGLNVKNAAQQMELISKMGGTPIQKARSWLNGITKISKDDLRQYDKLTKAYHENAYKTVNEIIKPVKTVLDILDNTRVKTTQLIDAAFGTKINTAMEKLWQKGYKNNDVVRWITSNAMNNDTALPRWAKGGIDKINTRANILKNDIDNTGNELARYYTDADMAEMYQYAVDNTRRKEATRIIQKTYKEELAAVGRPILEEKTLEKIQNNSYEKNKALLKIVIQKRDAVANKLNKKFATEKNKLLLTDYNEKEYDNLVGKYKKLKNSEISRLDEMTREIEKAQSALPEQIKLQKRIGEIKKIRVEQEAVPLAKIESIWEQPAAQLRTELKKDFEKASAIVVKWGKMLHEEGFLPHFNAEDQKMYVARFFEHFESKGKNVSEIFSYRDPGSLAIKKEWTNGLKRRTDMTQAEKDELVEMEDYLHAFYKRGMHVTNLYKVAGTQNVLYNGGIRRGTVIPAKGLIKNGVEYSQQALFDALPDKLKSTFETIPNEVQFGKLAGARATKDIADFVKGTWALKNDTPIWYDAVMSVWKKIKLFLDPVVSMSNAIAQTFNEHLHGYSIHRIDSRIAGLNEYINKGKYYQELVSKFNALGESAILETDLLQKMQEYFAKTKAQTGLSGFLRFLSDNAVMKKSGEAYKLVDKVMKTGYYTYLRETEHLSYGAAYRKMLKVYPDPKNLPRGTTFQFMRRFPFPFLGYTVGIAPGLIAAGPILRTIPWLLGKDAFEEYSRTKIDAEYKASGIIPAPNRPPGFAREDLKASKKESNSKTDSFFSVILPTLSKDKRIQTLNFKRLTPFGQINDVVDLGISGLVNPQNPIWNITMRALYGLQTYRMNRLRPEEMVATHKTKFETPLEYGAREAYKTVNDTWNILAPKYAGYFPSKVWSAAEFKLPINERIGKLAAKITGAEYESGEYIKKAKIDYFGRLQTFENVMLGAFAPIKVIPHGTFILNNYDSAIELLRRYHEEIHKANPDITIISSLVSQLKYKHKELTDYYKGKAYKNWKQEAEKNADKYGKTPEEMKEMFRLYDGMLNTDWKLGITISPDVE